MSSPFVRSLVCPRFKAVLKQLRFIYFSDIFCFYVQQGCIETRETRLQLTHKGYGTISTIPFPIVWFCAFRFQLTNHKIAEIAIYYVSTLECGKQVVLFHLGYSTILNFLDFMIMNSSLTSNRPRAPCERPCIKVYVQISI